MSYICLLANEKGVAAAGDSRLTFSVLNKMGFHTDHTRKVYQDREQGMVWACCGLTFYGGVNFFRLTHRVLRDTHRSLAARLNRVEGALKRATGLNHLFTRQHSTFTLLLCQLGEDGPKTTVLEVADGKATRKTLTGAVALQGGFAPEEPLPGAGAVAGMTVEELVQTVRRRTERAAERSKRTAKADPKASQTVGGNIRVVYLEAK